MFSFFRKHKTRIDILLALMFALGCAINLYEYAALEHRLRNLVSMIVLGLLAIFKMAQVLEYYRFRAAQVKRGHKS